MIDALQTVALQTVAPGRWRVLALIIASGLLGCREPMPAPEPTRGVILISLDTLAAGHLSAYKTILVAPAIRSPGLV